MIYITIYKEQNMLKLENKNMASLARQDTTKSLCLYHLNI